MNISIKTFFSVMIVLLLSIMMLTAFYIFQFYELTVEHALINAHIQDLFFNILVLFSLGFIAFMVATFMFYKKVFAPIGFLTQTILAFQKGDTNFKRPQTYRDEIGLMIEQFFVMKKKSEADYQSLHTLAITDSLTGIKNRRAFFEMAEQIFQIVQRSKEELAILMIDIDFFKKINDTHGHTMGDAVLKHITSHISKRLRKSDVIARYGGEEFIIMLPKTNAKGAGYTAQIIKEYIEKNPYQKGVHIVNTTVSIGSAQFQDDKKLETIITRADEALYEAKEQGRNRVVMG
jgi:diguanylate cyclase (GGDEF)-like protein